MGINGIIGTGASLPPQPVHTPNAAPQSAGQTAQTRTAVEPVQTDNQSDKLNDKTNQNPASKDEVKNAVLKLEKFVSSTASDIQFSLDDDSGEPIVKVIDRSTKEVIRQIPSKEMLEIAQALDRLQGLLIKQKA